MTPAVDTIPPLSRACITAGPSPSRQPAPAPAPAPAPGCPWGRTLRMMQGDSWSTCVPAGRLFCPSSCVSWACVVCGKFHMHEYGMEKNAKGSAVRHDQHRVCACECVCWGHGWL